MRLVPVDARTPDWPRQVAEAIRTLDNRTKLSNLGDYANDAAAATGGVPVGALYRNGSVLMIRVA